MGNNLGSTLLSNGGMGNVGSCSSKGALLLVAAANGDLQVAQEILRTHPRAALYYNFKDRSSPLIQAAARGHFELVQQLLEAAVISEGPERAKRHCIDHANIKRQTALMVACKHGHPDCVEYLVTNGADPLLTDERRHNTCLHFAALYGHSECVHKLLGCKAGTGQHSQGDAQLPVARITCTNDVDGSQVQFVDGHNGWGLTALHIAVFQGSVNTVKVLLRHGASLEVVISPPRVENSPIRCAAGSNALHIAALIGNVSMAKLVLEAQEAFPGLELRSHVDALGMRPHEYAQRARNPVMLHLLDERLPVHLLRQIWLNYSLDSGLPARHNTLASMLQKLKLMFNLEVIAIQRQITLLDSSATSPRAPASAQQHSPTSNGGPPSPSDAAAPVSAPATTAAGKASGTASAEAEMDTLWGSLKDEEAGQGSPDVGKGSNAGSRNDSGPLVRERQLQLSTARQQWASQMEDIQSLLTTVSQLHDGLQGMCSREAAAAAAAAEHGVGWPSSSSPAHEAILDFILSTLITPRTVSAVLHAAKKLVGASLMQVSGANGSATGTLELAPGRLLEPPPNDAETQHSLALLSTALRAVETCLHASSQLATPALVDKADRAAAAAVAGGAVSPSSGAAASSAAVAAVTRPSTSHITAPFPAPPPRARVYEGDAPHQLAQQQQQHTGQQRSPDGNRSGTGGSCASAPAQRPSLRSSHAPEGPPQAPVMEHVVQGSATASHAAGGNEPGAGDLSPTHPSHWSSHLHTLIAQLQWDIGVQRHRRRRAHAAASAARTAAANQRAGLTPPPAGPDAPPPSLAPVAAAALSPGNHASAAGTATLGPPPAQSSHSPAMTSTPLATVASDGDEDPNAESSASHAILEPSAAAGNGDGQQEPVMPHFVPDSAPSSSPAHLTRGATSPQALNARAALAPPPGHQALQHARTTGEASATSEAVPPVSCDMNSRTGRLRRIHLEDGGVAGLEGSGGGSSGSASPTTLETAAAGRRTHMHEVSPLASEIAACLSQDDSAAHEARLRSGAASAAACMPQSANGKVYTNTGSAAPAGGGLRSDDAAARRLSSPQGTHNTANHGSLCRGGSREQEAGSLRGLLAEEQEKSAAADLTIPSDCDDDDDEDEDDSSSLGSDEDEERGMCPICMDTPISVVVSSCQHGLCVQCAFQLTVKGRELPSCPFCRQKIGGFDWTQPEPMDHTTTSPKRKTHVAPKQQKGQQEKQA
mmetsp:Transcript_8096/g.19916  ORF Transcript_8096/g.19916 Transcript_8096/m.19916 type:complete len:1220 (-) Transcript_8096:755-4414(-)